MKALFKFLTLFYSILPLIVVPFIAVINNNWYYSIGIVFYYGAIFLVSVNQKIILMVPFIFCLWFWLTYGISLHDFVLYLFLCMSFGGGLYMLAAYTQKFIQFILPENEETLEYDLKVAKMESKMEAFRLNNPTTVITPEIIDTIRNEAFFENAVSN